MTFQGFETDDASAMLSTHRPAMKPLTRWRRTTAPQFSETVSYKTKVKQRDKRYVHTRDSGHPPLQEALTVTLRKGDREFNQSKKKPVFFSPSSV